MIRYILIKTLKISFKTFIPIHLAVNIFFADLIKSQPIPADLNEYDLFELSFDHGNNWNYLSSFQLFDWNTLKIITSDTNNKDYVENEFFDGLYKDFIHKPINRSNDSLYVDIKFGSIIQQDLDVIQKGSQLSNATTLYSSSRYSYGKYLRAWLYPRITNNKNKLLHYTGLPRKQKRAGFSSGEVDMSGIGFFGENVKFWIERGRQNWGAGSSNNLALSNNSAAYDQSVFQLDFRKLRYRYFHGFLETIEENNNRFITGKGLEYFNNKNFLIGFHEVSIYSGENRTIDFSYLNPVSTHLEIELNERDNHYGGTGGQNAIWQISMDYMPLKKLRLSSNILIDELALDNLSSDTLTSKNDYAVKTRLSYSFSLDRYFITAYTNYTYVSEYTFRHENGSNNFVSRSLPLGTDLGSDGYSIFFGIKMVLPWKYVADFNFGLKRNGENNLIHNLYDSNIINDLNNNKFSKKNKFASIDIKYVLTKNTNLRFGLKAFNYSAEDKIQYHYYCLVNSSLSTIIKF